MPRGSSGTYNKPAGTTAVTGTTIQATPYNTLMDDIASALTGSLPRDGSCAMQANLQMGGFKITGLGAGTDAGDSLRFEQFFAAGTKALFVQTAAPTGWTKDTDQNDKALRIVSGTASTGGSTAFSSVFAARTIALANLPSHTHPVSITSGTPSVSLTVSFNRSSWTYDIDSSGTGFDGSGGSTALTSVSNSNDTISATAASHTHSVSGTSGAAGSGTTMDFAVQYVDIIKATKD